MGRSPPATSRPRLPEREVPWRPSQRPGVSADLRGRQRHHRRTLRPKLLVSLGDTGSSDSQLPCAYLPRDLHPTRQPASQRRLCGGSKRKRSHCLVGKTVLSNLPQVVQRVHGQARTGTQVSGLPVGVLSQSSQPCLAPGPSLPTNIPPPQYPGARQTRPEFSEVSSVVLGLGPAPAHAQNPSCAAAPAEERSSQQAVESPRGFQVNSERRSVNVHRRLGFWLKRPRLINGQSCFRLLAGQDQQTGRSHGHQFGPRRREPSPGTGAMWLTLVLLAVLLLAVIRKVYQGLFASGSLNPFSEDVKRPPAPLVTDKDVRKKVLRQGHRKGPWGPRLRRGILRVCVPFLAE